MFRHMEKFWKFGHFCYRKLTQNIIQVMIVWEMEILLILFKKLLG